MTASAAVFMLTAYAVGCGATGPTKSGAVPVVGFTIAADPSVLPLGTIVQIDGLGERMVQDTGAWILGRHLDIFVGSCAEARRFGVQRRMVRITHLPLAGGIGGMR